jgi:hypothetical protein
LDFGGVADMVSKEGMSLPMSAHLLDDEIRLINNLL